MSGRIYANSHLVAVEAKNDDRDVQADFDRLADPAGEYEHVASLRFTSNLWHFSRTLKPQKVT